MNQHRKPFQAALNIFRVHHMYYLLSYILVILFFIFHSDLSRPLQFVGYWLCYKVFFINTLALASATLIYDFSSFYDFKWLDQFGIKNEGRMINITAGIDETSVILRKKFDNADVKILDIYNEKHAKAGIVKLRTFIPPHPNSVFRTKPSLPVFDDSVDVVFIILTGHDFKKEWRELLFKDIKRAIKRQGCIILVEPLADIPNFLAYNLGFLNYLFGFQWRALFRRTGFAIEEQKRINPFIKAYKLRA